MALDRKKLANLERHHAAKFREICAMIAGDLGLGEFEQLTSEQRTRLEQEANEATVTWGEEVEMADQPSPPTRPLQKLLAEHYQIGQEILDIRDGW